MKAIIVKGKGEKSKQFRFILSAWNGKTIATGEHYTRKSACMKTLNKYFSDYAVEDRTK